MRDNNGDDQIINEITTTTVNSDELLENVEDDTFPICFVRSGSFRSSNRSNRFKKDTTLIRRLVNKTGKYQFYRSSSPFGSIYFNDIVNTLISNSWYWILIVLFCGFFFSFVLFGCLYMVIGTTNDDGNNTETCLIGIETFTGYLLFSVETQMTIGFGTRSITHYCWQAVFVLCLQTLTGICICGVVISIFYEKISGSKKINSMNSFSRHATICQRNHQFCLIFRTRDINQRYQCNNQINAYILTRKGDEYQLKSLKLENVGFLIWPIEIVHRIDATSPLWDISAKDLIVRSMEIIVTMQGICLSTSNISSTTTSYLNKEILWGHRFIKCVEYDKTNNHFIVNHGLFNKTKEIPTPLCSAKRYQQVVHEISHLIFDNRNLTNSSSNCDDNNSSNNNNNNCGNGENQQDYDSGIASQSVTSVIVHNCNSTLITTKSEHEQLKNDPLLVSLERFLGINNQTNRIKYEETEF